MSVRRWGSGWVASFVVPFFLHRSHLLPLSSLPLASPPLPRYASSGVAVRVAPAARAAPSLTVSWHCLRQRSAQRCREVTMNSRRREAQNELWVPSSPCSLLPLLPPLCQRRSKTPTSRLAGRQGTSEQWTTAAMHGAGATVASACPLLHRAPRCRGPPC